MAETRVGSTFGPYRLDKLIGRGGMGEVYEAYDTTKDRVVALKLLKPELVGGEDYQERFRRECRAVARLQEPHIIPIHDFGVIDDTLYLDMRLVRGRNLKQVLKSDGRLAPDRAIAVLRQVASALDAAHADGLVHRDVKPENILLQDDFAYLVDFGVAHAEGDPQLTVVGTAVGSYAYMAPERTEDKPITVRSDVYSLACVLYEALTGAQPFPASSVTSAIRAHLLDEPRPVTEKVSDLPSALDAVVAKGLAKDPDARYASAGELAVAAAQALESPGAEDDPAESATMVVDGATQVFGTGQIPPAPPTTAVPAPGPPPGRPTSVLSEPTHDEPTMYGQPAAYGYPIAAQPVGYGAPPPGYAGVAQRSGSEWLWALLAVFIVLVIAGVGIVVWYFGIRQDSSNTSASASTTVTTVTAGQEQDTETATQQALSQPPNGSLPCNSAAGYLQRSAAGTPVTSCEFAEAVRMAYAAGGSPSSRTLPNVYSPVTGATYTMNCVLAQQFVTCTGGNSAVVYIY